MMTIATTALIFILISIYFSGDELAKSHQGDLNVVLYFFSLSLTATILLGVLAIQHGAIDGAGQFHGRSGQVLDFLLQSFLDLKTDIRLALALVGLVVLPQLLCYLLSGIFFGCATSVLFVGNSFSFLIWFVVKSFAVASGVGVSFALVAALNHWPGATWDIAIVLIDLSLAMLFLALVFLGFYRGAIPLVAKIRRRCPRALVRGLSRIHRIFTRRLPQREAPVIMRSAVGS